MWKLLERGAAGISADVVDNHRFIAPRSASGDRFLYGRITKYSASSASTQHTKSPLPACLVTRPVLSMSSSPPPARGGSDSAIFADPFRRFRPPGRSGEFCKSFSQELSGPRAVSIITLAGSAMFRTGAQVLRHTLNPGSSRHWLTHVLSVGRVVVDRLEMRRPPEFNRDAMSGCFVSRCPLAQTSLHAGHESPRHTRRTPRVRMDLTDRERRNPRKLPGGTDPRR